jgi:hypothetical protein
MLHLKLDLSHLLLAFLLSIPLAFFFISLRKPNPLPNESEEPYRIKRTNPSKTSTTSTMAAPNPAGLSSPPVHLSAPKLDLYTQEQLKEYDGNRPDEKIYVAVKGSQDVWDIHLFADMISFCTRNGI